MCCQKEHFLNLEAPKSNVLHLANNESTDIEGCGTIKIPSKDVTFVCSWPSIKFVVCSKTYWSWNGSCFYKEKCFFNHPERSKVIMVAKRIHNLYCFQGNEACRVAQLTHSTLPEWHERFGYLNENNLKDIIRQKKVSGIKSKPDESYLFAKHASTISRTQLQKICLNLCI